MKLIRSLLIGLPLGIADMVASQPTTNAQMGHIRRGDYILELPDALEEVPDIPEVVAFLLEGDGRVLYHFNATFVGAVVAGIKYNTTMARLRASPLIRQIIPDHSFELDTTEHATLNWGLDRIDTPKLALDGNYRFKHSGRNVEVYVLDSGLYHLHHEFHAAEPKCGHDFFITSGLHDDTMNHEHAPCFDQSGHGTHVSGVIRGVNYGVAKLANLVSVRVHSLHHGSTLGTVLAGFEYVMHRRLTSPNHKMIINLSLSGPHSNLMNSVVDQLVEAGVSVIVSAGNHNADSCRYSPASATGAITVGATDPTDAKAAFSNYGNCVDLYAPGSKIQSAWLGESTEESATLSGTSMAAGFVTGVMAQYMEAHHDWTPAQILTAMKEDAVKTKGPNEEEISIVNMAGLNARGTK